MKDNYVYRVLSFEDISSLEDLFSAAFNRTPKNNFFKWKYFENPFGDTILIGSFCNEKLVGSGAMLPEEVNDCGLIKKVYKCTDLMTHPDHQQKGISKLVNKLLIDELLKTKSAFSYTICSKVSTKSFLKNNWNYVSEISNQFKPFFLLKISSVFRFKKQLDIRHSLVIGDLLNNFIFSVSTDQITLNKTLEYLKWRISNPNYDYNLLFHFNQKNEVNGYLIYSISRNSLINIIDCDSGSCDSSIIDNLFYKVEDIAIKNKNRGILIMSLKGSEYEKRVKKRGYIKNPLKRGPLVTLLDLNVRYNDISDDYIKDIKMWNLSALNYDDI